MALSALSPRLLASSAATPVTVALGRDEGHSLGEDPVDLELMQDPVIDRAGHTFSRKTAETLMKGGKTFVCPLGQESVHESELRPNLFAGDVLDRIRLLDRIKADRLCAEPKKSKRSEESKETEGSDSDSRSMMVLLRSMEQGMNSLMGEMREIRASNQALRNEVEVLSEQVHALHTKNEHLRGDRHRLRQGKHKYKKKLENARSIQGRQVQALSSVMHKTPLDDVLAQVGLVRLQHMKTVLKGA